MIILAMELSTQHGSAALKTDAEGVTEVHWQAGRRSGDKLFRSVRELLADTGVGMDQVDLFAAGRGPGSYSGLRISLTAANAFALPGRRRVMAISSGEVLASRVAREQACPHVLVLGDARRDALWLGLYDADSREAMEWHVLSDTEEMPDIPESTLLVSSDWDRVSRSPLLQKYAKCPRIEENRYPDARTLVDLAIGRSGRDQPSEPLTPIYTQPPVLRPKV